jgi:ectoine hydroxylase-related dioxygenase (phytanoyl-CoA dioxygenase family)
MATSSPNTKCIVAGTGLLRVNQITEYKGKFTSTQLAEALRTDGYIFIRAFLPPNQCHKCQTEIRKQMKSRDLCIGTSLKIPQQFQNENTTNPHYHTITSVSPQLMSFQKWIQDNKLIANYLSHKKLEWIFNLIIKELFDSSVIVQLPFKWLRAVGSGLFTGVHCDKVYVGHISSKIITAWIPISPIKTSNGALIIATGSHNNETCKPIRDSYSNSKVGSDGTSSGWITTDPNDVDALVGNDKIEWVSADFLPGDIVILDINTIHMTATNVTDEWRLSCDTRFVGM